MNGPHVTMQRIAQIVTGIGVVLATLGVIAIIVGTALYDSRALAFPILVQVVVLAGEVGLATIPCTMLLRAARMVRMGDLTEAREASIAGGVVLIPGIGVAALFRIFANPCWDNPSCTSDTSFEDGVLKIGIVILTLAAGVALLLSPILLGIMRRSAGQSAR